MIVKLCDLCLIEGKLQLGGADGLARILNQGTTYDIPGRSGMPDFLQAVISGSHIQDHEVVAMLHVTVCAHHLDDLKKMQSDDLVEFAKVLHKASKALSDMMEKEKEAFRLIHGSTDLPKQ